jgi:hypothetical protein
MKVWDASAIARLDRDGTLEPPAAVRAFDRLKQVAAGAGTK